MSVLDLQQRLPLLSSASAPALSGSQTNTMRNGGLNHYQDNVIGESNTGGGDCTKTGGGTVDYDSIDCHRDGNSGRKNGIVRINITQVQRDTPRFPEEKIKTLMAFGILSSSFMLSVITLSIVHEKLPDRAKYHPLPDIFLDNFAPIDPLIYVAESFMMISFFLCMLVILLNKHRCIIFRRVCLILSLLYLMRCLTMYVTVLPVPSVTYVCSPKSNSTDFAIISKRVIQLISGMGLVMNGQHTYCGDYMYSGHTVCLVLAALIISDYTPKRLYLFHWMMWLMAIAGMLSILLSRSHYTLDVIAGYYVTTRLWWSYHTLANNKELLKRNSNTNQIKKEYWYPLFKYFDGNVDGPVAVQLEMPWLRRLIFRKRDDWNS